MRTKLSYLLEAMQSEDWNRALAIVAKFYDLGDQRAAILRARSAQLSPGLYQQMGENPDAVVAAGVMALKKRYGRYLGERV